MTSVNYLNAYPDATADPEFTCKTCKTKVFWTINDMCEKCFNGFFKKFKESADSS